MEKGCWTDGLSVGEILSRLMQARDGLCGLLGVWAVHIMDEHVGMVVEGCKQCESFKAEINGGGEAINDLEVARTRLVGGSNGRLIEF